MSDDNLKIERSINFGYAITAHKAQGSDYDYVILVVPEITPFVTRELIYTAFTRTKSELFLIAHESLRDSLPELLAKVYENSAVEQRKTFLLGFKKFMNKPHNFTRKDSRLIEVRSKIEWMIAKALDEFGIDFEYEPKDFVQYGMRPDFKFTLNNTYYLEHLGNMESPTYRNRNLRKFEIYEELGVTDNLITTSEKESGSDVQTGIHEILSDIMSGSLKTTDGSYSRHHYYL